MLDDSKKTYRDEEDGETEERSPKRLKLMNGESEDNAKENTQPNNEDKTEAVTSLFAPAQSTTNENTVSTTCDQELESFSSPEQPKAEPEVEVYTLY